MTVAPAIETASAIIAQLSFTCVIKADQAMIHPSRSIDTCTIGLIFFNSLKGKNIVIFFKYSIRKVQNYKNPKVFKLFILNTTFGR